MSSRASTSCFTVFSLALTIPRHPRGVGRGRSVGDAVSGAVAGGESGLACTPFVSASGDTFTCTGDISTAAYGKLRDKFHL